MRLHFRRRNDLAITARSQCCASPDSDKGLVYFIVNKLASHIDTQETKQFFLRHGLTLQVSRRYQSVKYDLSACPVSFPIV